MHARHASVAVCFAAVPLLVWGRPSWLGGGYAGVPGESNCMSCHPSAFPGGQSYTAGGMQRPTVTITNASARRWEFRLAARLAGTRAGAAGPVSSRFDWTPPATGTAAGTRAGRKLAISSNGVVNGASFILGMVAGSWITILGTDLSATTRAWRPDDIVNGNLPTQLDGVGVTVNGRAAYVSYISPTQINAQAPTDFNVGPVQVEVVRTGVASDPVTAPLQAFSPAFFLWAGRFAVATRPDSTYVAAPGVLPGINTTPARPGEVIILWGTGFGVTVPPMPAGQIVDRNAVHNIATQPVIRIGGVAADYIGGALAPDYVGLYQIAVRVPPNTPNGELTVTAEMGGVASPSNVAITVQR